MHRLQHHLQHSTMLWQTPGRMQCTSSAAAWLRVARVDASNSQPAGRHCMLLEEAWHHRHRCNIAYAGGSVCMMQSCTQQVVEAGLTCAKPGMSSMV